MVIWLYQLIWRELVAPKIPLDIVLLSIVLLNIVMLEVAGLGTGVSDILSVWLVRLLLPNIVVMSVLM